MTRWLLIAIASCAPQQAIAAADAEAARCSIGDPSAPAQLEIIHLDASFATVKTLPGASIPLISSPQGGWGALLGARATNIDGCRLDLTTSFRDDASAPIIKVDRRPTELSDAGDGWGIMAVRAVGNLQFCPQATATRDLYDQPYEVTVALDDAYGQRASQSMMIVPLCPADSAGCRCDCTLGHVVGSACP